MNNENLKQSLIDMIALLDEFKIDNWSQYFKGTLDDYNSNPVIGAKSALHAYGGMGSFNDCTLNYNEPITPKGFSISKKRIEFNKLHKSIYKEANLIIQNT